MTTALLKCQDDIERLEKENMAMREAIKEAHDTLENARFVHQAITTYATQDAAEKIENQKHCDNMSACHRQTSTFPHGIKTT